MEASSILGILELAALAVIAGLLARILRESRLLRRRIEAGTEKKDGQTINVNLAPLPLAESKGAPAPVPVREPEAEGKSEEEEPEKPAEPEEPPAPPPKPVRTLGSVTVTPGGAIAVKCPKCGSENSSFRTECFNCGSSLR